MAFKAKLTSRSDPKHTPPTPCNACAVREMERNMLLPTNSFQSTLNRNAIQSAFLHYTPPPCWIICFLGCVAAAGPPLAPLPFKVKQTQLLLSHREKKLVFSHLGSFFLFQPMHSWGRSFPFGHPNSGQAHAAQCCIHTPPFSLS